MSDVFVTSDTTTLGILRLIYNNLMRGSGGGIRRSGEQIMVAFGTSVVGKAFQNGLPLFLQFILAAEMVHIHIFAAGVGFGRHVSKIIIFRRQVTINTLYTNSLFIDAVNRQFPTLIRSIHFMAGAAAIFRRRDRLHSRVENNKTNNRKEDAGEKRRLPSSSF